MWVSLAKGFHSSSLLCTPHKRPQPDGVGWGGKEKLSPQTVVEGPPILGRHQELPPANPLQRHWWFHKLHITEGYQEERRANGTAGSSWASAHGPTNWDLHLPRFRTKEKTQSQQHRLSGIMDSGAYLSKAWSWSNTSLCVADSGHFQAAVFTPTLHYPRPGG